MTASLYTLDLSDDELRCAEAEVRLLAFQKWQEAGCPEDSSEKFWQDAELEWIGRCYVPKRRHDGDCSCPPPAPDDQAAT